MQIRSAIVFACLFVSGALAENLLPLPTFDARGVGKSIAGWTPSGIATWMPTDGMGGSAAISIEAPTNAPSKWTSSTMDLPPNTCYRMSFHAAGKGIAGATLSAGVSGVSIPHRLLSDDWTRYEEVFQIPSGAKGVAKTSAFFQGSRLPGRVLVDEAELVRVSPFYSRVGGLLLGDGESVSGQSYVFQAPFKTAAHNVSRPLKEFNRATFSTDRWGINGGGSVTYRHEVGWRIWKSAKLTVGCNYQKAGSVEIQFSRNGTDWETVNALAAAQLLEVELPVTRSLDRKKPEDVRAFFVRFLASPNCYLEINSYRIDGTFEEKSAPASGRTFFAEVLKSSPKASVEIRSFGDALPGGENEVALRVTNKTDSLLVDQFRVTVTVSDGSMPKSYTQALSLAAKESKDISLPYQVPSSGRFRLEFLLGDLYGAAQDFSIPSFYSESYGERLPDGKGGLALWTASSGYKIPKTRRLPSKATKTLLLCLAGNEAEAVQLVLSPRTALRNVRATASDLVCDSAKIPASAVTILREEYLKLDQASDGVGCPGLWPDPLVPSGDGFPLAGGENQPLWIRVKAPTGLPGGVYRGTITLSSDEGPLASVPLAVGLFGFDLPADPAFHTAAHIDNGFLQKYHRAEGKDLEAIRKLYVRELAEHRLQNPGIYGAKPWMPALDAFPNEAVAERRAAKEEVWWSLRRGLRPPFVSDVIDHPAAELRGWFWQAWKERVDGAFIGNLVQWPAAERDEAGALRNDPFRFPMTLAGNGTPQGNATGRYLFPPKEVLAAGDKPVLAAPYATIRLEMLRDGIEDYDYFILLRDLVIQHRAKLPAAVVSRAAALLSVPPEVSSSLRDAPSDPTAMEQRRMQIAKAIEAVLAAVSKKP